MPSHPAALIVFALADLLHVTFPAVTTAPARPALVLQADAPLSDLEIRLYPGPVAGADAGNKTPERAEQHVKLPQLLPGSPAQVPVGTGRAGRTEWHAQIRYQAQGQPYSTVARFNTLVTPGASAARVSYDPEHLKLAERYVEVQCSQAVSRGEVQVLGEDGAAIGSGAATFSGRGRGPAVWLRLPWTVLPQREDAAVLRLEVKLETASGFPARVVLTPWSTMVPHQEVLFATDKWDIEPPQRSKLDESFDKIQAKVAQVKSLVTPRLYIIGHTDTVGSDEHNLMLSQRRARAIAAYLLEKGLTIEVHYAGVGERVPRVVTPDNTDEPQNRRAEYVLAAGPPPLPAGVQFTRLRAGERP